GLLFSLMVGSGTSRSIPSCFTSRASAPIPSTSTWDKYDQVTGLLPATALAKRIPTYSLEISSSSLNQRPHQSMPFLTRVGAVRPSGTKSPATGSGFCAVASKDLVYMISPLCQELSNPSSLGATRCGRLGLEHPSSGHPASRWIDLCHSFLMPTVPKETGV